MQNYEIENKAIIEIVGTQYNNRAINHIGLRVGDKVKLIHESENAHDGNAILVFSEEDKPLGYFPKGQAALYAPAIESKKYSFTATVIETNNQDSERPILILSVVAEYQKVSDEELNSRITLLLKNIILSYNQEKSKYVEYLDAENITEEDVVNCWKKVRFLKLPFVFAKDFLAQKNEPYILENLTSKSVEEFKNELDEIELSVNEMLKEYQRMFNESVDIEDEDEYQRVQRLVREKRKSLKEIKDLCGSIKQTFDGVEIKLENTKTSEENNKTITKSESLSVAATTPKTEENEVTNDVVLVENNVEEPVQLSFNDNEERVASSKKENVIDLLNPSSYTSKKPVGLEFLGVYYDINTWIGIYETFIKSLYSHKIYKANLLLYIGRSLVNGRSMDFVDEKNSCLLRKARQIASDFYIEINLSVADILKRIRKTLDICGIEYDKIKIYYLNSISKPIKETNQVAASDSLINDCSDNIKSENKSIKAEEFILENAIKELMLADDDRVNSFRSENDGLSNEALEVLLRERYNQNISRFQIGLELLKNNDFETSDRIYYYLKQVNNSDEIENAEENVIEIVSESNAQEEVMSDSDSQDNYNLNELVIDILRKNADNIYYQDGMNAFTIKQLLPSELSSKVDKKEIEKVLSDHPNAREVEEDYYVYKESIQEESDTSVSDSFEAQSEDKEVNVSLDEDRNTGLERDDTEENIGGSVAIDINNHEFNLFDYSDALIQVCEFAIKANPFAMARISKSNISLDSQPMFYRSSVRVDECKKLSNGLQLKIINGRNNFQVISELVLEYCGISKEVLKVR